MQSSPLVTVITPTYNHEQYIAECIHSVQAQTFQNWEMIIVNDGSNDRTTEVVRHCIADDDRISIIDRENVGIFRLNETYQQGLNIALGKYIAIIDGDDVWEADKLELQVDALERNDQAVLSWSKAWSATADLSTNLHLSPSLLEEKSDIFNNHPIGSILNLLLIENCISALTITFRKSVLDKIGGFVHKYNLPLVDIPTLIELAKLGEFIYIDKPLGKWRTYARQTTRIFPVEITKGRFDLCVDQYISLPTEIRKEIYITQKEIEEHFYKLLLISYARSGRYKLIRRAFSEARNDYTKAIFYRGFNEPTWRCRAIVGYVFSLFHRDVEGISKLLGKQSYVKQ